MNNTLIEELAKKVQDEDFTKPMRGNEAQTRKSLIDKMLDALGYDTTNPNICVVEDNAGFQGKGGEKVDYSLYKNGSLVLILEAKPFESSLGGFYKQLSSYFRNKLNPDPKHKLFVMLSNGVEYRFFSDINRSNILDEEPFFVFDLKSHDCEDLKNLENFSYDKINPNAIVEWAKECIKYKKILNKLKKEIDKPSEGFIKIFAEEIKQKQVTQNLKAECKKYLKQAFNELFYKSSDAKISNKLDKIDTLNEKMKVKVVDFFKKAIMEALSSSSHPLTAKEIWEKIEKKYPREQIPSKIENLQKRTFEVVRYKMKDMVEAVDTNPLKFILKTSK
ncbi:hypothetical protein BKH42_00865 [Helicobacter sp. 13S00482-2]|uniref:type I restriction endonuclease n=1 Tax=Helicobacter sp. 13S00482-2 TaxID=1476200 RepID=UPI000BA69ABE|nr:type I restriction endonuclease [Helicobacter sp. 13S00482-2]PAF54492.1 hypothetical protein BKH42_00865 [Helicobacter sp. 13S00482-2]